MAHQSTAGPQDQTEKSEEQLQAYARTSVFTERNNVDEAKLSDLQKALSEAQTDRVIKQPKYEMAAASRLTLCRT